MKSLGLKIKYFDNPMPSNPLVNFSSNYLFLMLSNDTHSRFWLKGFKLASNNQKTIFILDYLKKYGVHNLLYKIEKNIIKKRISILLIEISAPLFDPFIILHLKNKYGLMIVLFAIDDEFKFDWFSSTYATIADLVLTTDYVSVLRYRQAGVNAHLFMHAIYAPDKVPAQNDDLNYDISFVGRADNGKPSRMELIRFLEKNRINVQYLTSSGLNDPLYLSRDEMYSVFYNSNINLNFSGITTYFVSDNVLLGQIRGAKGRPFEIAAAEGFCISEYSISLSKWFEDGVEIVFFNSKEDLLEKIRYYLIHKDEARRIAKAGFKKIKRQHSPKATAKKLLELIKQTQPYIGKNLYGETQNLNVSRLFAYSYIEFIFPISLNLLCKGNLRMFVNDVSHLIKFLKNLPSKIGIIQTFQVIVIVFYRYGKTMLAKVKGLRS